MAKIELNAQAPDFVLSSFQGEEIRLSDFIWDKNIILVFNRGFL